MKYLRSLGYVADSAERFVQFPRPGHKVDLFGFIDIVSGGAGKTVGVQTTTRDHMKERIEKILASPNYPLVRAMAWIIEVHGWEKLVFEDDVVRWRLVIYDMETNSERYGNDGWRRASSRGPGGGDRGVAHAE